MTGAVSYHGGLAAEEAVCREYRQNGSEVVARRWRSPAGEIDLILRDGQTVVFVEVKKGKEFASAAARVSERQLGRIGKAAEIFLGQEEHGLDSPSRIDVALVDGAGRIEILENVLN